MKRGTIDDMAKIDPLKYIPVEDPFGIVRAGATIMQSLIDEVIPFLDLADMEANSAAIVLRGKTEPELQQKLKLSDSLLAITHFFVSPEDTDAQEIVSAYDEKKIKIMKYLGI